MADTYTQIYIHIVFSVKYRERLIPPQHREKLHKFISGIIANRKQKVMAINSMPDHIHIFISMKPSISVSDLVRDIKSASSKFLRQQPGCSNSFNWQNGYGAFTYAHSQTNRVISYIRNQEAHHKKKTFREEYIQFLSRYKIDFDDRYVFDLNN